MAALGKKLRTIEGNRIAFWCPGCDECHALYVGDKGWKFNDDAARPTFKPSVLVRSGHFAEHHKPGDPCWCTFNEEHQDDPVSFKCKRCHSFVTDGEIRFLSDCSHELVDQTVPLPNWPKPPTTMKLTALEPQFLKRIDDAHWQNVDLIWQADGIIFVCPKCFAENEKSRRGVHSVLCWRPRVPQTTQPIPGRWEFEGTGYADLTLVAGSSSVRLTDGCNAHFFIRNGQIINT